MLSLPAALLLLLHTDVPSGWSVIGRAPQHDIQRVTLALRQPAAGLRQLAARLAIVADPAHAEYGQWLSRAEVEALVSPGAAAFASVDTWVAGCRRNASGSGRAAAAAAAAAAAVAEAEEVTEVTRTGGDAVVVRAAVSVLECMFGAPLHAVRTPLGRTVVRALPAAASLLRVPPAVEMHTPLLEYHHFARARLPRPPPPRQQQHGKGDGGHSGVTPHALRALYNYGGAAVREGSPVTQAVAELQHALGPEGFAAPGLDAFEEAMRLSRSLQPAAVVGGRNDGFDPTGECALDLQYVGAVAQGANTTFWLEDQWVYELALALGAAPALAGGPGPPDVVSISWGFAEARQCGPTDFGPDMPANCTALGFDGSGTYVRRHANAELLLYSRPTGAFSFFGFVTHSLTHSLAHSLTHSLLYLL